MFCPRCGTQNDVEQSYCSRCGSSLTFTRMSLEGRMDEALVKLKQGVSILQLIPRIFLPFLAFSLYFPLTNGTPGLINVAYFSAISFVCALPFIIVSLARFTRAERLLHAPKQSEHVIAGQTGRSATLLPTASMNEQLVSRPPVPISVTENTTLDLEPSEKKR